MGTFPLFFGFRSSVFVLVNVRAGLGREVRGQLARPAQCLPDVSRVSRRLAPIPEGDRRPACRSGFDALEAGRVIYQ